MSVGYTGSTARRRLVMSPCDRRRGPVQSWMRRAAVWLFVLLAIPAPSLLAVDALAVPAPAPATLMAPAPQFDFGTVAAGAVVEHDFVLENRGDVVVRIEKVRSSCGCTATQVAASEIAPGGQTTVHARFDTTGRSGRQDKEIFVSSNAPVNPLLVCRLTGAVEPAPPPALVAPAPAAVPAAATASAPAPAAVLAPVSIASAASGLAASVPVIDFGRVWSEERPQQAVTLSNTGTAPLRLLAVTDDCACFSSALERRVLAPGEKTVLRLQLHPGDTKGELLQTLTVATDEVGAAPLRLLVRAQIAPRIEAMPASLLLLDTPAGKTVERVLKLASNDGEAFHITRIETAVKGLLVEALPGGDGKTSSLRCRFTAPAEPGPLGGVVEIVTDRLAGGTVSLRVIGTVVTSGGPS